LVQESFDRVHAVEGTLVRKSEEYDPAVRLTVSEDQLTKVLVVGDEDSFFSGGAQ
jgi:hypothetical protein